MSKKIGTIIIALLVLLNIVAAVIAILNCSHIVLNVMFTFVAIFLGGIWYVIISES